MGSESEHCVDELLVTIRQAEELCETLQNGPGAEHVERARALVRETQLFIENNRPIIPSFTLKQVSEALRRLERNINSSNKSKLTFKFKAKPVDREPSKGELNSKPAEAPKIEIQQQTLGFQNKQKESLALGPDEVDSKDVSLVELKDCSVVVSGLANTVYIRDLVNTTVTICLACRAITVKNCTGCRLNLICQQLRIDTAVDCEFSIFTSARSMLEASRDLKFKELKLEAVPGLNLSFEQVQQLMTQANFGLDSNNWRCIDDFDWLSPDVPSKNYSLQ